MIIPYHQWQKILDGFCHDDYIISKTKVSDAFAIDDNTISVPDQKLEYILKCRGEQFRRNNVSLSHPFLQIDRIRARISETASHGGLAVQTLQHFNVPVVNLATL